MDLSKYEENRERLVDDKVMHLLSSNGELYPFTPEHINEALMELNKIQLERISEMCADISHPFGKTDKFLVVLGRSIWCDIYDYWENIAKKEAKEETPSAYELYVDNRAEAADARYEAMMDSRAGL